MLGFALGRVDVACARAPVEVLEAVGDGPGEGALGDGESVVEGAEPGADGVDRRLGPCTPERSDRVPAGQRARVQPGAVALDAEAEDPGHAREGRRPHEPVALRRQVDGAAGGRPLEEGPALPVDQLVGGAAEGVAPDEPDVTAPTNPGNRPGQRTRARGIGGAGHGWGDRRVALTPGRGRPPSCAQPRSSRPTAPGPPRAAAAGAPQARGPGRAASSRWAAARVGGP
jgi:hypothetical protein